MYEQTNQTVANAGRATSSCPVQPPARTAGISATRVKAKWCWHPACSADSWRRAPVARPRVGVHREEDPGAAGFTAFAAAVFGRLDPTLSTFTALLCGFAEAVGVRGQLET